MTDEKPNVMSLRRYISGWLTEYQALRAHAAIRVYRRLQETTRELYEHAERKVGTVATHTAIDANGGWDPAVLGAPPTVGERVGAPDISKRELWAIGISSGLSFYYLIQAASTARREIERFARQNGSAAAKDLLNAAGGWDVLTMGAEPDFGDLCN